MIRIAEAIKGMRVITPSGRLARVEGVSLATNEDCQRARLTYYDDQDDGVALQPKLLRGYDGPPVVFRDEVDQLRLKHGDVPLPPRWGARGADE